MTIGIDTNNTEQQVLLGDCTYYGKPYRARLFITGRDEGMVEILQGDEWRMLRSPRTARHFVADSQTAYEDWALPKPPNWDYWTDPKQYNRGCDDPWRVTSFYRGTVVDRRVHGGGTFDAALVRWDRLSDEVYLWNGRGWLRVGDVVAARFVKDAD